MPALNDLSDLLRGKQVAPIEFFELARKSLHFVGYEGLSMIAAACLDMAAWEALAKAAGMTLCRMLGGSVGPVKAYNSNGLWLRQPEEVSAEAIELRKDGSFLGLKLRMGRDRPEEDIANIEAVRKSVRDDMLLMVDYNQAFDMAEALKPRQMIDDLGLDWIEEPIV